MSRIYEALQQAQKQRVGKEEKPSALPVPFEVTTTSDPDMGEEMLGLYKKIDALFNRTKSKVIQFIGAREGEGASTISREFARVAADRIGDSVLLMDADRHMPSLNHYYKIQNDYGWVEALKQGELIKGSFQRIGQSTLFVSPSTNSTRSTPEIFKGPIFEEVCQGLRDEFDWVLIDSAPLSISPDGLAIAAKADGIILVVEAERTKWQVAKEVKDSLTRVGGNILGVVLNKRRYYIPQSIYKHL